MTYADREALTFIAAAGLVGCVIGFCYGLLHP